VTDPLVDRSIPMADVLYVVLTIVAFAVVALVARGAAKL
jgi:hypothetical protein